MFLSFLIYGTICELICSMLDMCIFIPYYLMPYQLSMNGRTFHTHTVPLCYLTCRFYARGLQAQQARRMLFFFGFFFFIAVAPKEMFATADNQGGVNFLQPSKHFSKYTNPVSAFLWRLQFACSSSAEQWAFFCNVAMNEIIDIMLGTIFITFGNEVFQKVN